MKLRNYNVNPALVVIDVQNGFVSKGGSYDLLGMDTSNYRQVIPRIKELIDLCRENSIPVFYTQAEENLQG
jgi:ureidoacrylate peracid hydrolase